MKHFIILLALAMMSSGYAQVSESLVGDGLAAWWPFDGNFNDFSGNNNHCSVNGSVPFVEDRNGIPSAAISFSGNGSNFLSVIYSQESFTFTEGLSISAWVNSNSGSGDRRALQMGGTDASGKGFHILKRNTWLGYKLQEGGANDPAFGLWSGSSATTPINLGEWHHVVFSVDFASLQWNTFLDGVLVESGIAPIPFENNQIPLVFTQTFEIGRKMGNSDNGDAWSGFIDDVGIWNRALSGDEVMTLFNAPAPASGCTDENACNYSSDAQIDDGSCVSCVIATAFCGEGTTWDAESQTCIISNPSDTDFDGCVSMTDLLDLLTVFGTCAEAESEPELGEWSCGDPLEYQGYDYETVQIGEQCWFAENARFLPEVSPSALGSEVDGLPHAYVYGYDGGVVSEAVQSAGYANGVLYNFDAVISWDICPAGWYVPSDEDWMTLESFLGMDENELEWFYPEQGFERGADEEIGFKLKSVEWDGGNSTGFSALSNGWRWTGVFAYPEYTNFWTSTQISPEVSWARILREGESGIARQPYYPHFGKSVRCVQESE